MIGKHWSEHMDNQDDNDQFEAMRDEIKALKAELAAFKAQPVQEPVLYQVRMRPLWLDDKSWSGWESCSAESAAAYERTPVLNDWEYTVRRLYPAAPVQKPVAYEFRMRAEWIVDWGLWTPCNKGQYDTHIRTPKSHGWLFEARALYAAPCAASPAHG